MAGSNFTITSFHFCSGESVFTLGLSNGSIIQMMQKRFEKKVGLSTRVFSSLKTMRATSSPPRKATKARSSACSSNPSSIFPSCFPVILLFKSQGSLNLCITQKCIGPGIPVRILHPRQLGPNHQGVGQQQKERNPADLEPRGPRRYVCK